MPVVDGTIISNADALVRLGGPTLTAANVSLLDQLIPRAERAVQDYVGYEIAQATFTEYLPDDDLILDNDPLINAYEGSARGAVPLMRQGLAISPMMLSRVPIRSITTLHENLDAQATAGGSWTASHLLTQGTDYFVDWDESGICWSGKLYRQSGSWPVRRRTVKIVYVHGFSVGELAAGTRHGVAFREATFDTLIQSWLEVKMLQPRANGQKVGPIESESYEGWSQSFAVGLLEKLASMNSQIPKSARQRLRPYVRMSSMIR